MEALRVGPMVFGKSIPVVAVAAAVLEFGTQVADGHTWQRAALSSGLSLALGVAAVIGVAVCAPPACSLLEQPRSHAP